MASTPATGNTLLDHWISTSRSMEYDTNGDWTASDSVNQKSLKDLA